MKQALAVKQKKLERCGMIVKIDEIKKILPHTGGMLLLDEVLITSEEIIGKLTIRKDICEGHKIGGKLIMKGSDYADMAAQLVGIIVASDLKYKYLANMDVVADGYEKIRLRESSICGEKIFIYMPADNFTVKGRVGGYRNKIIAWDFIIRGSEGQTKATIAGLSLLAIKKSS
jgi:3-hydroxymyristoyl/3-hydroxydecanoyl-(acyl carrier protein) dehydratase